MSVSILWNYCVPEVECVGELEVSDGVADLAEGIVGDVLDAVVRLQARRSY